MSQNFETVLNALLTSHVYEVVDAPKNMDDKIERLVELHKEGFTALVSSFYSVFICLRKDGVTKQSIVDDVSNLIESMMNVILAKARSGEMVAES